MNMYCKTLIAAGLMAVAGSAQAATFAGYEATSDVYFDDTADLLYFEDAGLNVGSIVDDFTGDIVLDVNFEDLGGLFQSGFVTTINLATLDFYDGTLIDYMYTDNMSGDDELALLFQTDPFGGATAYAIGSFIGELGGDFLDFGGAALGSFELVGARSTSMTPVPLPAGLPLLLAGLGGLAVMRRKQS